MKRIGVLAFSLATIILTMCLHLPPAFAEAKPLTLAIGLTLPPYNIPEIKSGMEFDIVKEALGLRGYKAIPKYVPFGQRMQEMRNQAVDGVLTVTPDCGIDAFYSAVHIMYQNVAVSLQKNHFSILNINDLQDKSVAAFQEATVYLGKDYAAMAKTNGRYQEVANQQAQVSLLYSGEVDVIVLDKNIFYFFSHHYDYTNRDQNIDTSEPVVIHRIFPPSLFSVVFTDNKVRDDFDSGLAELRKSGRYDKIIEKYVGR
jgi:polar amino acid transport system substrate-binding protein